MLRFLKEVKLLFSVLFSERLKKSMYTMGKLSCDHQNSIGLSGLGSATFEPVESTVSGSLLGLGLVQGTTVAHSDLRSHRSCLGGIVCRIKALTRGNRRRYSYSEVINEINSSLGNRKWWWEPVSS